MTIPNRELSQFGSFVVVDDDSKLVSIGSSLYVSDVTGIGVSHQTAKLNVGLGVSDTSKWIAIHYSYPEDIDFPTRYFEIEDYYYGVSFDNQKNVYTSGGAYWEDVCAIVKTDTKGDIVWQRFLGTNDSWSEGSVVRVDKTTNDVYLGVIISSEGHLVKLDSSGNILWKKYISTYPYVDTTITDIKIDSSSNVYVACGGWELGALYSHSSYILKFNSSGSLIWQNQLDNVYSFVIDSGDNVIACLTNDNSIVKMDSNGSLLWKQDITWTDKIQWYGEAAAVDVQVDSSDNIYIVGNNVVTKLDQYGNLVWSKTYKLGDVEPSFSSVKIDNDLIYVTGNSESSYPALFLVCIDTTGSVSYSKILRTINPYEDIYQSEGGPSSKFIDVFEDELVMLGRIEDAPLEIKISKDGLGSNLSYNDYFLINNVDMAVADTPTTTGVSAASISTSSLDVTNSTVSILNTYADLSLIKCYPERVSIYSDHNSILDSLKVNDIVINEVPLGKSSGRCSNFIAGVGAGSSINNYATNYYSGYASNNNFLGCNAGTNNYDGSNNNFFGYQSGYYSTSSEGNNFFGYNSGYHNTTGSNNNFLGNSSGYCNIVGSYNNFFGSGSGYVNCGYFNNFFGSNSGTLNDTGSNNNFFGNVSGRDNRSGSSNNFFGTYSGSANCTGSYNLYLGAMNGGSLSASHKIIIGSSSDPNWWQNYPYNLFDSPNPNKDFQLAIGVKTDSNPANYWIVGDENFNVGIGSTNPSSKLSVGGNVNVSGNVNATAFFGDGSGLTNLPGSSNVGYANTAGISTYSRTAGIATYATSAGIATYATSAGIATYATSAGIATYATSAGIATYATSAGVSTVAQGLTGTPSIAVNNLQITGNAGVASPTARLHLPAGTNVANTAPLKFTSGSNLTSLEAGTVEYDGTTIWATPNTSLGRSSIPTTIFTSGSGTAGITGLTNYALFPSTNDTITLPIGTYLVRSGFIITVTGSVVAATLNFNIRGAGGAVGNFSWRGMSGTLDGGATVITAVSATALGTNVLVAPSATSANPRQYIVSGGGILRVTSAGTIIPSYQFSTTLTAGTTTLSADNYMTIQSLASTSSASNYTGAWS